MDMVIFPILGWTLIIAGMLFILSGTIALIRFPDFYTKLHGASVIEGCGLPLCLFGLAALQDSFSSAFKLILIAIIVFIINPVSTHALARCSMKSRIDHEGRIR